MTTLSTPSPTTAPAASSLPPAAVALAARMFDAARRGQMDIFQQALPAGLPATLTNDKGDSLIMLASYHGHAPLVRLLLAHGADANALNDRGQSPLAGAVFKHEPDVVDALVEGGADPEWGSPSAVESMRLFRMEGQYAGRFEGAGGRGRMGAMGNGVRGEGEREGEGRGG
ncbi:hypothetical protein MMC34_000765 [Xylographa carneopallida]|nr:hypothetical protein [Xylographa carneopallida]